MFDEIIYKPYFALEAFKMYTNVLVSCKVVFDTKEKHNSFTYIVFMGQPIIDNVKYECYMKNSTDYVIITCNTAEELRNVLKEHKIVHTEVKQKQVAREFLRNNMPIIALNHSNRQYHMGVVGLTRYRDYDELMMYQYDVQNKKFGRYISTLGFEYVQKNLISVIGWQSNKGWYNRQ